VWRGIRIISKGPKKEMEELQEMKHKNNKIPVIRKENMHTCVNVRMKTKTTGEMNIARR
jgi:hypothetical protein